MLKKMENTGLVFVALSILLASSTVSAAPNPLTLNFQGKLLDTNNNPQNGSFNLTFRLFSVASGGSALWSETDNSIQVTNGVFQIELGQVTPLTTSYFTGSSTYLETQVVGDASPMSPRQRLDVVPYAFRAVQADDLIAGGSTNYVQVTNALQPNSFFHVSSATVDGLFLATGVSTFSASGNATYSLVTASGVLVQNGTLNVQGSGGVNVANTVAAATVAANTGMLLPQAAAASAATNAGAMTWDATQNLMSVGTNGALKTMADTNSAQILTNKTLNSTGGNVVDATRMQTRTISNVAPSDGMALHWSAAAGQWLPQYIATLTVVAVPFAPSSNLSMTADIVYLIPVSIPGVLTVNSMRLTVTASRSTNGDVGIYNAIGLLVAHAGANAVNYNNTGTSPYSMLGAPITLLPGQYYFAVVVTGNTPALRGIALSTNGQVKGLGTISLAAGAGSTLPGNIVISQISDGANAFFLSANQ